jgi:DNA-binding NarL/FixJ family response regulator
MNILLIDDEPMTIQAYISVLTVAGIFDATPEFSVAHTCQDAFEIITKRDSCSPFDLAMIDQSLPKFHAENILCGGDLAMVLKQQNANCKIILITSHSEVLTIYDLLKRVQPIGFIIKSDVDAASLLSSVRQVIEGKTFYSDSVNKIVKEIGKKELMVDEINRKILILLSKGYKIDELLGVVPLSVSSIKRRIALMKDAFDAHEDKSLVKEAIQLGYL